jgi:hypothetical protein
MCVAFLFGFFMNDSIRSGRQVFFWSHVDRTNDSGNSTCTVTCVSIELRRASTWYIQVLWLRQSYVWAMDYIVLDGTSTWYYHSVQFCCFGQKEILYSCLFDSTVLDCSLTVYQNVWMYPNTIAVIVHVAYNWHVSTGQALHLNLFHGDFEGFLLW